MVRSHEEAVEAVLDVVLAEVNGPAAGIGVPDTAEDSVERASELHGFVRDIR